MRRSLKQEYRALARTPWAMSVSSEVQRTLVKSPPELWAELSDPTTLARHLGELGEIRIVRTEPDRAVDWEAAAADGAQASGRVEIEPSGWGTRVTLSVSRVIAASKSEVLPETEAAVEPDLEPVSEVELELQPKPEATEALSEVEPEPQIVEPESEIVEPEPQIVAPEPRRGFFARLFRGRKNRTYPEPEPAIEVESDALAAAETAEPDAAEPSPEETAPQDPVSVEPSPLAPTPEPDISAELAELEEQTTAVLTGVLDRLGAAHHRPFSRS